MLRKIGFFLTGMMISGITLEADAADIIRINGSGSALDMMKPMIAAYMKVNPKVSIVMEKPLGSSGAIKALLTGILDIAVSSKQLKPEEQQQGAVIREYGKTPLLFVTNMDVKKNNISTREVEELFSGKQAAWPDGNPVRLVLRPESDIDTKIVRNLSPEVDAAVSAAMKRPGMIMAVTDPETSATLATTAGAFGAASLSTLVVEKPRLNQLSLNGVKGSVSNLADGSYPLGKEISFVTTAKTPASAMKFLDFVYSAKGRTIARNAGVNVTFSNQGVR